jgi:hypothetical protein
MTTTPQEPASDPGIVPSGNPDPIHVDPVTPGEAGEPEETDFPE